MWSALELTEPGKKGETWFPGICLSNQAQDMPQTHDGAQPRWPGSTNQGVAEGAEPSEWAVGSLGGQRALTDTFPLCVREYWSDV